MKTYTAEELKEILAKHRLWWFDEEGGERADLSGADLSGADLRSADLSGADLRGTFVERVYGQHFATIGNIGSRNSVTIYHADADKVFCGCFRGNLEEFKAQVARTYPEGHEHREEYEIAIAFFIHAKAKLAKPKEDAE